MASPERDPDLPTTKQPGPTEPTIEADLNVLEATVTAGDVLETAPKTVVIPVILDLEHEEEQAVGPEVLHEPVNPDEHHGPRPRKLTEKGLQYQIELQEKMLRSAITVWRRKINAAEMMITDSENADEIRTVRNDMMTSMNRVEEIYEAITDMNPGHSASIELIAEKHQDIKRRIGARINDLKLEKSTIRSRHSSRGLTRSSRALN